MKLYGPLPGEGKLSLVLIPWTSSLGSTNTIGKSSPQDQLQVALRTLTFCMGWNVASDLARAASFSASVGGAMQARSRVIELRTRLFTWRHKGVRYLPWVEGHTSVTIRLSKTNDKSAD